MSGPVRPRPERPERPERTPAPAPFGSGPGTRPDIGKIQEELARTIAQLKDAQVKLLEAQHGPGPDGQPPVVGEPTRADELWPWLLIRWQEGDYGQRPVLGGLDTEIEDGEHVSPDIIVKPAGPADEPVVADRETFPAIAAEGLWESHRLYPLDVWVHVWNLGRAPATGVRVRVILRDEGIFLGGRQLDLGDRLSPLAHRAIKVATFTPGAYSLGDSPMLIAIAECMSDVATGNRMGGQDRHVGHRRLNLLG